MRRLLNFIKSVLSVISESLISVKEVDNRGGIQVNCSQVNGNITNISPVVNLNNKESAETFVTQTIAFLEKNLLVDVNSERFKYYINQSLIIIKLNDSISKRFILKELLYKKFGGEETGDDSDASTTIALEAMKYLTDTTIKHMCVFRLLLNTIPSVLKNERCGDLSQIVQFVNNNGVMNQAEIMHLRRCGMLDEMSNSTYYWGEDLNYSHIIDQCEVLKNLENPGLMSNCFSPAGLILTDIALEYFIDISGECENWLPIRKRSWHVNSLIVDEGVEVNQNLLVKGDVASGG